MVRARAAIVAGENSSARRYLERFLNLPSTHDQKADAYYFLSEIARNDEEKRGFLESALAHESGHHRARRSLAILDGKLNPAEIINPDTFSPQIPAEPQSREGDRFECPNCGNRLTYSPDGHSLVCEYCQQQSGEDEDASLTEYDFIVDMARAQGHQKAQATQSFECKACGAVFLLAPEAISLTCPHCDSAYSITQSEIRELIPPEGIIPFAFDSNAAEKLLRTWIKKNDSKRADAYIEPFSGVYLPAWTFDVGGNIRWTGYVISHDDGEDYIPVKDERNVHLDDVFVAASKPLPKYFNSLLDEFDAKDVRPFSPKYIANWMAETYKIALSDAAIEGRSRAFQLAKEVTTRKSRLGNVKNLSFYSDQLMILSFKLVLVPVWMGHYSMDGERFDVLLNGKTGEVYGEKSPGVLRKWVNWLLDD